MRHIGAIFASQVEGHITRGLVLSGEGGGGGGGEGRLINGSLWYDHS